MSDYLRIIDCVWNFFFDFDVSDPVLDYFKNVSLIYRKQNSNNNSKKQNKTKQNQTKNNKKQKQKQTQTNKHTHTNKQTNKNSFSMCQIISSLYTTPYMHYINSLNHGND